MRDDRATHVRTLPRRPHHDDACRSAHAARAGDRRRHHPSIRLAQNDSQRSEKALIPISGSLCRPLFRDIGYFMDIYIAIIDSARYEYVARGFRQTIIVKMTLFGGR